MKYFFSKTKTIDRDKTYGEPQLMKIPLNRHRQNYDFEVISGSVWDDKGNEYLTKEGALSKGVEANLLTIEEDFIDEHVNFAYRYECNNQDKIDLFNAKKCGLGVVRMLQGEHKGIEFLFPLYETIIELSLMAYGYITHNYIDKKAHKELKKDTQLQNELRFIVAEFGGEKLYNEIMSYHP